MKISAHSVLNCLTFNNKSFSTFSKMKFENGLNLKKMLTTNTYEFCENTTLHGLKYVADKKLKLCERGDRSIFYARGFFGLSIITVICIVTCLILGVYRKWETTPVIVGIDPKRTSIAKEPFPAVTICNLNLALKRKVSHFSKKSSEYTMLRLLCKRKVHKKVRLNITTWNNLENFIINISQSCEEMLVACRFGGVQFNCKTLFDPLITDGGLCCVFNILPPEFMYISQDRLPSTLHRFPKSPYFARLYDFVNWSAENGYGNIYDIDRNLYPHRVPGIGESIGLSVTLNVQKDQYYCSSSSSVGFKFALHSPNEWPSVKELGVFIEPGKETKIHIKPDKTVTSKKLKSINSAYRGCLFTHEKQLKFFAHYTQRNCEMEFMAEVFNIVENCSCYYMPIMEENITICSPYHKNVQRITNVINLYNIHECLPSCNDLNFQIDSFSTKLSRKNVHVTNQVIKHLNDSYVQENIAVVHMFFKENTFRTNRQMEFIGLSDFLSSIGGLMGLFLGFSLLSIAELFYFAILRPICSIIVYYKNMKNVEQHLNNERRVRQRSHKIRKLLKKRHNRFLKRSKIFDRRIHTAVPARNIYSITNNMYDQ